MGVTVAWRSARSAHSVEIQDGVVTFRGMRLAVSIPATAVVEVRRARGDVNEVGPLTVRTVGHGTVRLAPRLTGLVDFLVELRQANPSVRFPGL